MPIEVRVRRRTPLPPMALSELPALKALMKIPFPTPRDTVTKKTVMKAPLKKPRSARPT